MTLLKSALLATSCIALLGTSAQAQSAAQAQLLSASSATATTTVALNGIDKLIPRIENNNITLDYSVLSEALNGTVIRLGPSHRRHMSRPSARLGSRFVSGHTTPYRLEGSRVSFSFFNEEFLGELTAYRKDLERIGTQIDLTHMAKDEQLAFWLNLHNVAVIEQISMQYPTKYPNRLKVNGTSIDDIKFLNIKGVALSTKDIREKIVFPNWTRPETIYGFFRGDIGSPALQNYAYTGANVQDLLVIQAGEFVNALRGFNKTSKNRNISKLYEEAKPYYFASWDADLAPHLLQYARPDVAEDIRATDRPWRIDRYDAVIADLVGGSKPRIATGNVDRLNGESTGSLPDEVIQLLRELNAKTDVLRKRKLIGSGTVTIEDVDTIDIDVPPPPTIVED